MKQSKTQTNESDASIESDRHSEQAGRKADHDCDRDTDQKYYLSFREHTYAYWPLNYTTALELVLCHETNPAFLVPKRHIWSPNRNGLFA
jgi:hypothetical protein